MACRDKIDACFVDMKEKDKRGSSVWLITGSDSTEAVPAGKRGEPSQT